MGKQKLVVIGNGMAGVRCVQNILNENANLFKITIFGREPHSNYSRIMLSSVLQGETSFDDIVIHPKSWYEENNIQLFSGETVTEIDKDHKCVKTDKLREVSYDKLIIATGSSPIILPLPGSDREGVMSFRTIEDCHRMVEVSKKHKKAVVIGGGLLGLEAARGLLNIGMKVDVVHKSRFLMEKQLDQEASLMLQTELENQGMHFLFEKDTEEIVGGKRVEGIRFKDGDYVETDLVVMAVGVRPNIKLAQKSKIETNKGILVDDFLATRSRDIYAVGECAEHEGMVYGLVKPLYEQGEVLAQHLCGNNPSGYRGTVLSTQLKISGVDVFSVGQFIEDRTSKTIHYQNEWDAVYKKVVFRGNKVIGAVLFGDTRLGPSLLDSIVKQRVIADKDKASLLESPNPSDSFVASLPVSENICTCNSVSKRTIIHTVQQDELTTIEEVKNCTKASSSCGGCKSAVSDLLDYIHSEHFNEGAEQRSSLCHCTSLDEDEIVRQIQLNHLSTLQEVMDALDWKFEKGCSTCRPALEFYLGIIFTEYEMENEHSFLNERMNATLQKDGTYAVTPQFYGGVLDGDRYIKISKVVEKYPRTKVAISSDQNVHILGVREEELEGVWAALDMPLRSFNENMVHVTNTGIGEYSCLCDQDPSLRLSEEIERKTSYLRLPNRIKVGISPCLHKEVDSITKDIGVIRMNQGWEIYVGGSGDKHAQAGELLYVVSMDKKASEIIRGFIEYYRESANYLEPVWRWVNRIGVVHIREALLDEELLNHFLQNLDQHVIQRKHKLTKSLFVQ
ncbi:nitrite reductase large subunit NirB [Halobacillus karajensis]|uniref:Nitrite reductase [NAD(P)H] n=1 Tax=Halobacillus karajensis TaxID=195088 RepID=A0A024P5Z8_9BACI|nr:nitrite reductase large subunit NirB [Halobacillus karajensis]CDQ20763.1 Nitrite reductase [NAD(P)H] [Halobacillus karajensis]CDQ23767.1 Nitrite reductase [NAD(P)H] [Halobacillus karajensis]CDQ27245.1 Nitrite reductase [NAD(P)H] [Halobacillus karajensis]